MGDLHLISPHSSYHNSYTFMTHNTRSSSCPKNDNLFAPIYKVELDYRVLSDGSPQHNKCSEGKKKSMNLRCHVFKNTQVMIKTAIGSKFFNVFTICSCHCQCFLPLICESCLDHLRIIICFLSSSKSDRVLLLRYTEQQHRKS